MVDVAIIKKNDDKNHASGHRGRLRERLLKSKSGVLPDYEILEILLFATSPRRDVKPLAKELIKHFGSLAAILTSPLNELRRFGIKDNAIAMFRAVQESGERILQKEVESKPILQSWKALQDYCRLTMAHLKTENFRTIYLNKKNMVIANELQDTGTIDETPIYPREIVKRALELSACAVIIVHNHPSGNATPSGADISATRQVIQALATVGITLHDHLIIAEGIKPYSFKSNGLI
jgi:DNA repair protein RadC